MTGPEACTILSATCIFPTCHVLMIPMQKIPAFIILFLVILACLGFLAAESGSNPAIAGIFSRSPKAITPAISSPSPYILFIEPDSGRAPIIDAIDSATRSINLTIYNLNDKKIMAALENASARGIAVRVIYDAGKDPESEVTDRNLPRMQELESHGVLTRPGPAVFAKTHQKTFTIDGKYSLIMTCNLKPDTFSSTRDFIVRTDNLTEVREIGEVFDADWNNRTATYRVPTLVWSPDHARATILSLIEGAHSDITIYNENLEDPLVVENLSQAAKRGVLVRVLIPDPAGGGKKRLKAAENLADSGVAIRQGTSYYMHAKVLIADNGTGSQRAFVGSQNFETQHLDKDRELGLLLVDPAIISGIQATFEEDWSLRSGPIPFSPQ
ncbi:phospholipase D-like domain-containing protein [uncultured Methanoregula sp.]|uniref:phospholipase D-like domain-containing protein n=1 Tax=uncultured Methanoregula sp. TaxID=1005933 RepID=UPI002AAAD39D|nr:phospholipase D-like domain-containing protein [uncultured Methanoregula sp.]